ncbi:heavy metal transporter [Agromyces sp. SYSU K20354]|uniref:heavy metal transporter n=1 Tax=Agromyces cavernae TaxID=2898659 RepID=UPI001E48251B|nr:heavy metal transporter [Agromyces cavernae]MCD2443125.1 heavy metal transporter [Agromyces cavernae]
MNEQNRPARERVTSVDGAGRAAARRPPVRTGPTPVGEADTMFTRSLMRAQARLAFATVLSFVVVVACAIVVITAVPALDDVVFAGVPLPWLIQAYGFYPIILVHAVAYALLARRAERRFNALVEHE